MTSKSEPLMRVVLESLTMLATVYPSAGYMKAQLQILAGVWLEDLSGFSPEDVREAVRQHRRTSNFFPTPAQIVTLCKSIEDKRHLENARHALPEFTGFSEEQVARNLKGCRLILDRLAGRN